MKAQRVKIVDGGKLVIPASMRAATLSQIGFPIMAYQDFHFHPKNDIERSQCKHDQDKHWSV
jgi:hypothetical protein